MPSLAQVFQLVNRYGADSVQFDIETKRDPTLPKETVGPTTFAKKVIAVISRYHMTKRSVLQSFDWSTLQAARKIKPRLRRAALAQKADDLPRHAVDRRHRASRPTRSNGDLARVVADKLHAQVLSVNYPDITDALIKRVAPARADDDPVDRQRTRPTWRRRSTAASTASSPTTPTGPRRDGRQGPRPARADRVALRHRGPSRRARATGRRTRCAPFRYGLDHGVDTLEMDIGVTKDGVLVMSHNRQVNGVHCHDTAPVTPGDPLYPYAGKNIKDLTLAQIKTLDCGFTDPGFPKQVRQPGEKMPRCRRSSTSWPRAATRTCASTSRRRSARWSTTPCPMTS